MVTWLRETSGTSTDGFVVGNVKAMIGPTHAFELIFMPRAEGSLMRWRVANPITLLTIMKSVRMKTGILAQNPQQLVDLIRENHLEQVIAGTHEGKPITHAAGIEAVTGERLTLKRAG